MNANAEVFMLKCPQTVESGYCLFIVPGNIANVIVLFFNSINRYINNYLRLGTGSRYGICFLYNGLS